MTHLFIDGALDQEWPTLTTCVGNWQDSWMSIGMFRNGAGWCCPSDAIPSFLGDLDWIRISAGARYTSAFTPPFECEVAADAQTQLLLKFNEPASVSSLIDESSSHFVCNLGVPVSPGVVATSPTLGDTIDGFPSCSPPCVGDVSGNGLVDAVDLAAILVSWGTDGTGKFDTDINDDGLVTGADLALVLTDWGACP